MKWFAKKAQPKHGIVIAALVLALDQALKAWMLYVYDIIARAPVKILPFFDLVMVWNVGISFGMLAHGTLLSALLLALLALAITAWLIIWLGQADRLATVLGLGLVIGGAIGNVFDRMRFGAVADFFSFHWHGYAWPAFNIADAAICIGVALLLWESMLQHRKT